MAGRAERNITASLIVLMLVVALFAGCRGRGLPAHVWLESFDSGANRDCWPTFIDGGLWISSGTILSFERDAVVARNPRDGSEVWRYGGPDFCFQNLAHEGQDVVVLETSQESGTRDRDYFVAVLDVRDGKMRWRTKLPDDAWSGTLAIGESTVYAVARVHWDPGEISKYTRKEGFKEEVRLHALGRADGALKWSTPVASSHEYNPVGSTDIALGPGYALVSKNTIYGHWGAELFDAAGGERIWGIPLRKLGEQKHRVYGKVALLDEKRFAVVFEGTLEHRSIESGELIATIPPSWDRASGAIDDGRLYIRSEFGEVEAFSVEDGRRLWKQSFGVKRSWKGITRGHRGFFMQGDRISVGVGNGCVYVIESETGQVRGRLDVYRHHSSGPAVLSDDLVIVDGLGLVVAYEPRWLDCRAWYPF